MATSASAKAGSLKFNINDRKVAELSAYVAPVEVQQDEELKTQAQILADLKAAKAANEAYKAQVEALKGQVGAQSMTIQVLTEQKDFYKQEAEKRAQAGTIDDANVMLLRQQITEDRQEINGLRAENDSLRSSRDRRTLFAGLGGLALGSFLHK